VARSTALAQKNITGTYQWAACRVNGKLQNATIRHKRSRAHVCPRPHDGGIRERDGHPISYFAETTFRRQHTPFGIKQADRLSHIYMIGKTGVGKSTLLEVLARQDLEAGRGFALIDPHGDLAARRPPQA